MDGTGEYSSDDEIAYIPQEGSPTTILSPDHPLVLDTKNSLTTDGRTDGNPGIICTNNTQTTSVSKEESSNLHNEHDLNTMGLPSNFGYRQDEFEWTIKWEARQLHIALLGLPAIKINILLGKGKKKIFIARSVRFH